MANVYGICGKENAVKQEKTDRRTVYTRKVLKDGLLELMGEKPYEKITVAALCRQAEVTRSTFYLHYTNLDEVLDEVLDDALRLTEDEGAACGLDELDRVEKLIGSGDAQTLQENNLLLPVCQRVADNPRYRVLFCDNSLSDYIVRKIYLSQKKKIVPLLQQKCGLDHDAAEKLFMFVIYGAFYVNRSVSWEKNSQWYDNQIVLLKFITGGINSLKK